MELKEFRDILPAAGSRCTVRAELPIEAELLISDYHPQIFKIIRCFAQPVVLEQQLQPGRIQLEGYLRCTVFYQGEDGQGLCQAEQKLPFTKSVELPSFECTSWAASVGGETEYLNTRAVTSRRVEVRGAYALTISLDSQLDTEVLTALSGGGIQQRGQVLAGARRTAVLDKLINTEGELAFPQAPAAILDLSGWAQLEEVRLLSGKAVAKGMLHARCLWRAEGEQLPQSLSASVPFQQVAEVEGVSEDCKCLCVVEPIGFRLTQEEGSPARLTVSSLLHLRGWRQYEISCLTDVFSTTNRTEEERLTVSTEQIVSRLEERITVTGNLLLSDESSCLLAGFAAFSGAEIIRREDAVLLTAKGSLTLLCENSLGEMESWEKPVELTFPLEGDLPAEQLHPECWLSVEEVHFSAKGAAAEVSAVVRLEGAILSQSSAGLLSHVEMGERIEPSDPEVSLRICYAQAGESIFEIARRYHVSPKEMLAANRMGDEEERLTQARRLLVPGV